MVTINLFLYDVLYLILGEMEGKPALLQITAKLKITKNDA